MNKVYGILFTSLLSLWGNKIMAANNENNNYPKETITLDSAFDTTEIHGDLSIGNFFTVNEGRFSGEEYSANLNYRLELQHYLYNRGNNRGKFVTRAQGSILRDTSGIDFFLDNIPELFYQNKYSKNGTDIDLSFGRFVNRRFFDNDEITADPFDIGERLFPTAPINTNALVNQIGPLQNNRAALRNNNNGVYGFVLNIKDTDGNQFLDRWGFKQAFAVAELKDLDRNFFIVSELNKVWGYEQPGQFNLGFLYGELQLVDLDQKSSVVYTSLVQQITNKLSAYTRYGLADVNNASSDLTLHALSSGLFYDIGESDRIETHLVFNEFEGFDADQISSVSAWTHGFNDNFYSSTFVVISDDEIFDESATLGFNLTAIF